MNDLIESLPKDIKKLHESEPSGFEMRPRTLDEAMKFCEIMANSELVPKDYRDKPGNIMVAIQLGQELGLTPMRALRCIAVINGRASMWGDEMLALVLASPICEYVRESESTDTKGICKVKRKGDAEEHVSTFTLEDAKRAGLLGKQGPWQTSTKRMLTLRARGFALRDKFPDVLAGLVTAEEALDIPVAPVVEAKVETPPTLKDKLKAKVEEVSKGDATTQPGAAGKEEMEREEGNLAAAIADSPQPPASSSLLDTSNAINGAITTQEVNTILAEFMRSGASKPDQETIQRCAGERLKQLRRK